MSTRPDWDDYFLGIAEAVSRRGECLRSQVGAVIVSADRRIVSTGYNGAPAKHLSCLKGGCPRGLSEGVEPLSSYDTGPGSCIAIHAEANALLYSSRDQIAGGTIYVTRQPCDGCMRLLLGSGLSRAFWTLTMERDGSTGFLFRNLS